MFTEKRQHPRYTTRLLVSQEFSDDDSRPVLAHNISMGGMGLVTAPVPEEQVGGKFAWYRFVLPGQQLTISALGEVVRQERVDGTSARYGIRFKYMFPRYRQLLTHYLTTLSNP